VSYLRPRGQNQNTKSAKVTQLVPVSVGGLVMLKKNHLVYLDWTISMLAAFSMVALFGAQHPNIFLAWIIIIFIGVWAKIWLYHRINSIEKEEPSGNR